MLPKIKFWLEMTAAVITIVSSIWLTINTSVSMPSKYVFEDCTFKECTIKDND